MIGRRRQHGRRVPRKDRKGFSAFAVGVVTIIVAAIIVYFGFTKDIPFTKGYQLNAVFESAVNIREDSPVRIAGVNVGKVKGIKRYRDTDAAVVEMEIEDSGLPIHRDATMKIRPRIFLEGNFFVDLFPGTPSAPKLDSGDTIPMTQTSGPVQLDQVLTALQSDARRDLQNLLDNYGEALQYQPTPADDVDQDPDVQGETAAKALNDSYTYAGPALRNVAIVNEALLGTQPGDLSRLIRSFGRVAGSLNRSEEQLKELITNFNLTTAAFASESGNLSETIRLLPGTLRITNEALDSLNAAFPPTRAFAREILPGVRATPGTIDAAFPWIAQVQALVQPSELGGLVDQLQPATRDLALLTDRTITMLPQLDLVQRCVTDVILPTGDVVINDPPFSTGVENYKEFWYTMVGLTGEGQNFDGNGGYVRFQVGGGPFQISTGRSNLGSPPQFANMVLPPLGIRPAYPGRRPPYRPDATCYRNRRPDLNSARRGPAEHRVGTVQSRIAAEAEKQAREKQEAEGKEPPSLAEELARRLDPFQARGGSSGGARGGDGE